MADYRIDLTCRCGARLQLSASHPAVLATERQAFNEHHAKCPAQQQQQADTDQGDGKPVAVAGSHHSVGYAPTSVGFSTPATDPWKRGDR